MQLFLIEPAYQYEKIKNIQMITKGKRPITVQRELQEKLKAIKRVSLNEIKDLVHAFLAALPRLPSISLHFASTTEDILKLLTDVVKPPGKIAIQGSILLYEHFLPKLLEHGYHCVATYTDNITNIPSISCFPPFPLTEQFVCHNIYVSQHMLKQLTEKALEKNEIYDLAVLVPSVVSCDGALVFVQHRTNILQMIEKARSLLIILPLERMVHSEEEAIFVAQSLLHFGSESLAYRLKWLYELGRNLQPATRVIHPEMKNTLTYKAQPFYLVLFDNECYALMSSPELSEYLECIGCLRCDIYCPVSQGGGLLRPSKVVRNARHYLSCLKEDLIEAEPMLSVQNKPMYIGEEEIWACTLCEACSEVCPLQLKPTKAIKLFRRNLLLLCTTSSISKKVYRPIKNLQLRGQPWEGLETITFNSQNHTVIDFLLWPGCMARIDHRIHKIVERFSEICSRHGRIPFIIPEPLCCGEPALSLGDTYTYEEQVDKWLKNIEWYTNKLHTKTLVTLCPHCFNILKKHADKWGGKVFHHTEFLFQLLGLERIHLLKEVITYHDSCYLGRLNGVYDAPRALIQNLAPNFREMLFNREKSRCCGAGGGRMWLPEFDKSKAGHERFKEVLEVKADVVVTSCPFCLTVMEEAKHYYNQSTKVLDITELVFKIFEKTK